MIYRNDELHGTSRYCNSLHETAQLLRLTSHHVISKFALDSKLGSINLTVLKSRSQMFTKLLKQVALVALIGLMTIQLCVTESRSQCPTTTLPPGCSWAGTGQVVNIPIPGTGCMVTAQYCYACCNGTNYFHFTQMAVSGTGCTSVHPQAMLDAAVKAIFLSTSQFGCNPCPNGGVNVQVSTPGCWMKNVPQSQWQFLGCTSGPTCVLTATVTCVNGVPTLSNCTSTQIGSGSCDPNPDASGLWPTGICYRLDCPPAPCP